MLTTISYKFLKVPVDPWQIVRRPRGGRVGRDPQVESPNNY